MRMSLIQSHTNRQNDESGLHINSLFQPASVIIDEDGGINKWQTSIPLRNLITAARKN